MKIDRARARKSALRLVASFEFVKGVFVLCIGVAAILLVHKDAWYYAESLLVALHINPDRRSAQLFLDFADRITDARLWAAARLAFVYAALRFTEAYGLWKERTWAEWVALVSGALLVPVEIHSLFRKVTLIRVAVFVGNLLIVLYMFLLIRAGQKLRREHAAESGSQHGN